MKRERCRRRGFTIAEVVVGAALVLLLAAMLAAMLHQTSALWRGTRSKVEQFREARQGFETLTQRLSQATLNTYWDYDSAELPTRYQRRSELRFTCGAADVLLAREEEEDSAAPARSVPLTHGVFFHAPIGYTEAPGYRGLENLLNAWGYFVEFGSDEKQRPRFITAPPRWRPRLMEFVLPTEKLPTYSLTSGRGLVGARAYSYAGTNWFSEPFHNGAGAVHVLAENIIALVLTPRLSKRDELAVAGAEAGDRSPLAPNYNYDSSPGLGAADPRAADARLNPINQLPPIVDVTMVAIDETSAERFDLAEAENLALLTEKFRDTSKYSADLRLSPEEDDDESLERALIERKLGYRIFTSSVTIRGAKWSRAQEQ